MQRSLRAIQAHVLGDSTQVGSCMWTWLSAAKKKAWASETKAPVRLRPTCTRNVVQDRTLLSISSELRIRLPHGEKHCDRTEGRRIASIGLPGEVNGIRTESRGDWIEVPTSAKAPSISQFMHSPNPNPRSLNLTLMSPPGPFSSAPSPVPSVFASKG